MLNLASAVALLIVGGRFDVNAGVAAEGRAGVTPVATAGGFDSTPSAAGIVTPGGELQFQSPRLVTRLTYGLRIFESVTRDLPVQSPLYLHNATLSLLLRPGRRFDATAAGSLSYGEADYSYFSQVLGQMQPTLPPPLKFLSLSMGVVTHLRLTPLWTLQTAADVLDRRQVDSAPPAAGTLSVFRFPHQRSFDVIPSLIGRITRRDDIIAAVGAVYQATDGQQALPGAVVTAPPETIEILSITPNLGWRVRLSRRYDFHIAAGLTYSYLIKKSAAFGEISPVAPTGAVDLTVHLLTSRAVTLRGMFGATFDYFLDPVLGVSGTRGTSFARLTAYLPLEWTAGFDASFTTLLTSNQNTTLAAVNPDQTVVAVAAPVRHRISRNFTAEMGLRYTDRAPNLGSANFSFHAHEAWLYFVLTATSRAVPEFRPQ
jgi:hypothetical protein